VKGRSEGGALRRVLCIHLDCLEATLVRSMGYPSGTHLRLPKITSQGKSAVRERTWGVGRQRVGLEAARLEMAVCSAIRVNENERGAV
jgi:hypothetical protein